MSQGDSVWNQAEARNDRISLHRVAERAQAISLPQTFLRRAVLLRLGLRAQSGWGRGKLPFAPGRRLSAPSNTGSSSVPPTSRASRGCRTASAANQTLGGASPRQRDRRRARNRAESVAARARGRRRASSARRSRQQHAGVGRRWSSTGYSITWHLRSTEVNSVRPKRPGPATSCAPSASSGSERSPTSCA
jgi:hypothetical protein